MDVHRPRDAHEAVGGGRTHEWERTPKSDAKQGGPDQKQDSQQEDPSEAPRLRGG
jgi:hypothetical protein